MSGTEAGSQACAKDATKTETTTAVNKDVANNNTNNDSSSNNASAVCSQVTEATQWLDASLHTELLELKKALLKSVDGALKDHINRQEILISQHVSGIKKLCGGTTSIRVNDDTEADASECVKAVPPRSSSSLFNSRVVSPQPPAVVVAPCSDEGEARLPPSSGPPGQLVVSEAIGMTFGATTSAFHSESAAEAFVSPSWNRASFSNLAARGNTYMASQARWSHSPRARFLISIDHGSWMHRKFYDNFGPWLEFFWDLEEPPRTSNLAAFVDGSLFAQISAIVILMNAVQSAVAANEQIAGRSISGPLQAWEIAFMFFYTLELSLKIWVHRIYFLLGRGRWWNIFDAVLVALGLFDVISALDDDGSSGVTQFAFLRMLRILRAGRALRSLRALRAVTELRTLLTTVVKSVASLFWSVCMILFIYYIFSLIIVQVSIANVESPSEEFLEHFGSVQTSMLTLFILSLGGGDLQNFYDFLDPALNKVIVVAFMLLFQITLLNILTGVYVEAAMKYAQPHRSVRAKALQYQEFEDAEELWAFFASSFNSESVTPEALSEFMKRPSNEAFLETFDIHIDPELMYSDILEKEGQVTLEGLVKFVLWHRGPMTKMDILRTDRMLKEVWAGTTWKSATNLNLNSSDARETSKSKVAKKSYPLPTERTSMEAEPTRAL